MQLSNGKAIATLQPNQLEQGWALGRSMGRIDPPMGQLRFLHFQEWSKSIESTFPAGDTLALTFGYGDDYVQNIGRFDVAQLYKFAVLFRPRGGGGDCLVLANTKNGPAKIRI
jgi:hypothetical protein